MDLEGIGVALIIRIASVGEPMDNWFAFFRGPKAQLMVAVCNSVLAIPHAALGSPTIAKSVGIFEQDCWTYRTAPTDNQRQTL